MLSEKETTKISKFLSLVLRHKPETIDVALDGNGWVNAELLLEKLTAAGMFIDRETLDHIVATNPKKRFASNNMADKIRASQGHSVDVELGYEPLVPPEILYHGTAIRNIDSISATGLEKRSRQHVHLSKDANAAQAVCQRHSKPFIFEVLSGQMYNDGFTFFLSENNVWLTDSVPAKYLKHQTK